jgi:RNA polymerase sigma-70 factor (ECF subfamily)
MSPPMRIGKFVFRKSLLVCSCSPGNGHDQRPTPRDVVQEAFVRFWQKQHNIDNRSLLYATVRSIALDFLRRDSRRARRESAVFSEGERSVQPKFEIENESQQELAAAVALLPNEQREVLVMKIWNELTFAEIATVLGISQNTAASRYRYALAALKKNFVPQ